MSTRKGVSKKRRRRRSKTEGKRASIQPLDRAAISVMGILVVVIVTMLALGSQALPSVRTFSWQDKAVGADDVAFLMSFTQPVDPQSVETNLTIEPALAGKFSWAGQRMAYTLEVPAPYGETYTVSLDEADTLSGQSGFEPFASTFDTRERIFAYVGAEGEERGRLVMFNLTRGEKTVLTPADQTVLDFQPYPGRDCILYSALTQEDGNDTPSLPKLYNVFTGIEKLEKPQIPGWQFWRRSPEPIPAKTTKLILGSDQYQNLKFDLSPNGKVIVVQRVNRDNPADFGPWVLSIGESPRKLKTEPGGDFRIAPDNRSLLLQQGKGTAVIALEADLKAAEAEALLDFLPDYGLTLDIANDGSAAALVNFNQDDPEKRFTQSLFWVSNKGDEKQLLQTDGAIVSAQFNENGEILYCLVNKLLPGEGYQVMPYLMAVNVKTGAMQQLLEMPPQPETTLTLSPDGLAILFDEALPDASEAVASGEEFLGATHRLWLLPLFRTLEEQLNRNPNPLPPTRLKIAGRHPAWLP